VWDLQRAFADFWNLHRERRACVQRAPLLLETASSGSRDPVPPQRPDAVELPDPLDVPRGDQPGQPQNVWMTHAYFIPDQDFVDTLRAAAQRGVDVRSCSPASPTTSWPTGSPAATSPSCSTPGVRIFRFRDAMVHAKTATIDGSWSTVGTANVDRLSLQGNYEINVEFIDGARRA
jgi:cardiolipin synthase